MNFGRNHAPSAGLIARPFDQKSSTIPLCHGCPHKELLVYKSSVDIVTEGENVKEKKPFVSLRDVVMYDHFIFRINHIRIRRRKDWLCGQAYQ